MKINFLFVYMSCSFSYMYSCQRKAFQKISKRKSDNNRNTWIDDIIPTSGRKSCILIQYLKTEAFCSSEHLEDLRKYIFGIVRFMLCIYDLNLISNDG